ncbi:MAG: MBL fold metallo-hydrolase [Candidatus Hodarchaeales archaeon]|jgi:glyoxylase-like metal-dependent hydrolase (beta-lactamase superfamily II)
MATEITPESLYNNITSKEKPIIIDVRSPESFNDWNIFYSQNIPFNLFQSGEFKKSLPKSDKPVVIVCNRGNDSKLIANFLKSTNMEAVSLMGGMKAWNSILHPVKIPLNDSKTEIIQFQRLAKGCLSYIVVNNGEAAVVDPLHNIDPYINYIEEKGYETKYIFETHLHADHVSGSRLLQDKTGAKLFLSNKDLFRFDYEPINYEESIYLGGEPIIYPIHTPGHTKGSTCYKISEEVLVTGDTIFLDSLGRPDLANKAVEFAYDLHNSLHKKIKNLPNNMQVVPAHHSKIAIEHLESALRTVLTEVKTFDYFDLNEQEFVDKVVSQTNKTERPTIYEKIIRINSGAEFVIDNQIPELEMGSNKCAISK